MGIDVGVSVMWLVPFRPKPQFAPTLVLQMKEASTNTVGTVRGCLLALRRREAVRVSMAVVRRRCQMVSLEHCSRSNRLKVERG